ncbi:SDR family oxidoreductase [Intrasporangium calvum]
MDDCLGMEGPSMTVNPYAAISLEGRTALVTGGSSGIGAATCELLASRGAQVAVNYRSGRGRAEVLVSRIKSAGGEAIAVHADVTSPEQSNAMVKAVVDKLGPIDILVNAAGAFWETQPFAAIDVELWNRSMALNFYGAVHCCTAVLDSMRSRQRGSIVNLSSIVAKSGGPGETAHYASAKGALETMTYSIAREYAASGVRANAVAPGLIDTPVHDDNRERFERIAQGYAPLGRPGTAHEVAEVVAFLASDAASYVTAQVWNVNGGRL